ncbi:MAG: diguanylate cyclase [Planctomycetota bacterium]
MERLRAARADQRAQQALLEAELERLKLDNELLAERARFVEELSREARQSNERLEILAALSKEMTSFDLDGVLEVCLRRIPFLAGARCASLYLHDPRARTLRLARRTHSRELDAVVELDAVPDSLMAVAVREREILCIDDLGNFAVADGRNPRRPYQERYQTASCVVAPLVAGGEVEGVLNLADRFDARPFAASRELAVVRHAADLLAVSLKNARLFAGLGQAAREDRLTGLTDRRAFTETLEIEVKRAQRYGNELAVLACKLHGLRLINANHGLPAGDRVIEHVGRALRGNVRDVDLVGRTDGAEFGLILPEQAYPGAAVVARRLAERLGAEQVELPDGTLVSPGLSIGIAVYPRQGTGGELYQQALEEAAAAWAAGLPVGPSDPPPAAG